SLRIMPCCCSLGEAAGAAAFLSCEGSLPVNRISIGRLQEILISKNAKI
ncbi:MAG: FAD-dependent oxidoreductase, partial [Clostridia bacterium]|nr:FAD-dependent oxidoreductase [Clostridia bacterium]